MIWMCRSTFTACKISIFEAKILNLLVLVDFTNFGMLFFAICCPINLFLQNLDLLVFDFDLMVVNTFILFCNLVLNFQINLLCLFAYRACDQLETFFWNLPFVLFAFTFIANEVPTLELKYVVLLYFYKYFATRAYVWEFWHEFIFIFI